jgi:hypothetical protein
MLSSHVVTESMNIKIYIKRLLFYALFCMVEKFLAVRCKMNMATLGVSENEVVRRYFDLRDGGSNEIMKKIL